MEVEAWLGGVKDKEERVSDLHENHSSVWWLPALSAADDSDKIKQIKVAEKLRSN